METLHTRRAIVCGSTKGIGKACAMELASRGATVTLVARKESALRDIRAMLPALHHQAHDYLTVDFARPQEVREAVEESIKRSGTVHILVNNTGGPPSGPITIAAPDAFLKAFEAHVIANQLLAQAVIPGMKEAGFGRIINILSTSVIAPIKGLGVSNTIRAAVANWARTLAVEIAPFGITVNNVLPGYTDTARLEALFKTKAEDIGVTPEEIRDSVIGTIPAARLARPEEIAAVVGFLASPEAAYVCGVNLPVDGGRTAAQ